MKTDTSPSDIRLVKTSAKTLNLMLLITTLLLMVIIGDNIRTSLSDDASDRYNYDKRKKYYEEVIVPANLDLHPAEYYITIDR